MTVPMSNYAPFNSGAGGDVTESVWRDMMYHVRDDGVIATKSYPPEAPDELQVFGDSTGMQVKVKPGEAWIRGHWGEVLSQKTLAIAASHVTNDRYDLIVARADFVNNRVELDVKTGTPAGSPTVPTLTQNTSVWEIPLAEVFIDNGAVTITAGNVTDRRRRVGTGLFNHHTPTLYYEGSSFGTRTKNVVSLGDGTQQRWCRWFRVGNIVHIRYDFRWGANTSPAWNGGTGRVFTELPPDMTLPAYPTRIAAHLWTHTPTDRDWFGTALLDGTNSLDNRLVYPFFPRSATDCRIIWYSIGGVSTVRAPTFTDTVSLPVGGSLVLSGHFEVK